MSEHADAAPDSAISVATTRHYPAGPAHGYCRMTIRFDAKTGQQGWVFFWSKPNE